MLYEAEASIILLDEEDRGCNWQIGWVSTLALEVLIKEAVQLLLLNWNLGVDLSAECLSQG